MSAEHLLRRVGELKQTLQGVDPGELAQRIGAETTDSGNTLTLPWWGNLLVIRFPEVAILGENGEPVRADVEAMVVYHLVTSDGSLPSGKWISFHDLPDGKFYAQAFRGYTGGELVRSLIDVSRFAASAEAAGGVRMPKDITPGDVAFRFEPLPRVPLLGVFWDGDDEMPASAQVLFDSSASHHLPTDAAAIMGSMLVRRIVKAAKQGR